MIVAIMDTGSFCFHAAGADRDEALEALRQGWENHRKQYVGAVPFAGSRETEYCALPDYYGVAFLELKAGDCARDGEPLA